MKRLFEEFGISVMTLISGIIIITIALYVINNPKINNIIGDNFIYSQSYIQYEKEYVAKIEACDMIVNNAYDLDERLREIKAYSNLKQINNENVYFDIMKENDELYNVNIIVKYNGTFMAKNIKCHIDKKGESNENNA